jgi:hypothetical protein
MKDVTFSELFELVDVIKRLTGESKSPQFGPDRFSIAVLDRGFVYVGRVSIEGNWCVIADAKNIRVWGTTDKGLGWLAINGPTTETKLDDAGTVRAPLKSLIHLLDSEESKWKKP